MAISKTKEYRKNLAEMFANILEEKELDWKKEWQGLTNMPVNAKRDYRYKGINSFHLMLVMMERGYDDPRWATFNQIKEMGCKLNNAKGMGVQVEYWFPYDLEEKRAISWQDYKLLTGGMPDKRFVLRAKYSTVFNAAHIEGLPERVLPQKNNIEIDSLVNTLSEKMGVEILYDGGDRAFYRNSEDKIHLPRPEAFKSDYACNTTALHELAHSTGAKHRLNRKLGNVFGSEEYAYEELIAEITSCFMSVNLNTEQDDVHIDNHKAYVQSWVEAIREKPETLMKAIAEAEKAAAYMEYKAELIPEFEYEMVAESSMEASVPDAEPEHMMLDEVAERRAYKEDTENKEILYNGMTKDDILLNVYAIMRATFDELNEYEPDLELETVRAEIYGSRTRRTHSDDSDLDILVEYRGGMKEDALFNILNEYGYQFAGMKVDFNPIRAEESGTIEEYLKRDEQRRLSMNKQRLLVDMDGTVCVFKEVDTLEKLYEEGYFLNLEQNENVVEAVKRIIASHPEIEVYIMSSVLSDSKYALKEKNAWLDKYLPEIDHAHRIFPPCGDNKLDYVPDGIRTNDCLLDDYTHNLTLWEPPAKGIKLLNGINHTHQTWKGSMVSYADSPEVLAENIIEVMRKAPVHVVDIEEKPAEDLSKDLVYEDLDAKKEELMNEYKDIKHIQGEIQTEITGMKNTLSDIEENIGRYLGNTKKVSKSIEELNLEERYTEAMQLAGFELAEPDSFGIATVVMKEINGDRVFKLDGWQMVGTELEELQPLNESDRERFELLIHPKGRVSYYVINPIDPTTNIIVYPDFNDALDTYTKMQADGKRLGYVLNESGIEYDLASFNTVTMKNSFSEERTKFDELTQNELEEVRANNKHLVNVLRKDNVYHQLYMGFNEIAINHAVASIVRNKSEWGAWLGRIANTHRPQDYVNIDIMGYKIEHEITCKVEVVHANEIVHEKEITFNTRDYNFEESVREGMRSISVEFDEYLKDVVDLLDTDVEYPMQLYAPGMAHTLDEHYELLENTGYDIMPGRQTEFSTKLENNPKLDNHDLSDSRMKELYQKNSEKNIKGPKI